ncbi:MAG TPA: hypothetical protein VFO69_00890 [Allosphingosinicella sp.]|nr:hypothetical protein [Allosphingosinicella sp.]
MPKSPLLILIVAGLVVGCSSEEPPAPDPGTVERLLVRLDSQSDSAVERLPHKARQKVQSAERLVAPLEKVQADKIDPNLALALIE